MAVEVQRDGNRKSQLSHCAQRQSIGHLTGAQVAQVSSGSR